MIEDFGSMLNALIATWRSLGVETADVASLDEIRPFERQFGIQMPSDLMDFFTGVGGMREGATDQHGIRFWSLAEVQPAYVELIDANPSMHSGYFVFADYSIWAHGYAIKLSSGAEPHVAIVGGVAPIRVAVSFTEFLWKYLHQPESIFSASSPPT
jgi:hypothetical protein